MNETKSRFHTFLAVALVFLPVALAAHEGEAPHGDGFLTILAAATGGPADVAGLKGGDRLLEVAGQAVASLDDLNQVTSRYGPGDEVQVVVQRDGERHELALTFGEREGGVSIGVSLAVMSAEGAEEFRQAQTDGVDADGCLAWVDETYRLSAVAASLDYDLGDQAEKLRACMTKDLTRMPARIPTRWCDNAFKVHCSGLDLLTEIGEAQVAWCEEALADSLGIEPRKTKAWTTCGEDKVFDRLSMEGRPSDAAACRAALEECGFEATTGRR